MSILDSIKGERKLSFNCWRYRLLHWCFEVEDADQKYPEKTGLPKFLYTHYCPLFHLTNLIAILLPVILLVKAFKIFAFAMFNALSAFPLDKVCHCMDRFKASSIGASYIRTKIAEDERTDTYNFCREFFTSHAELHVQFDEFWNTHVVKYIFLDKEAVKAIFLDYMPKVIEARERQKLIKDQFRERMVFWINFSRVFIKWAMNVLYFVLTGLALYVAYLLASPVWWGMCWLADGIHFLFTDEGSVSFLLLFVKVFLFLGLVGGAMYGLAKAGFLQRFGTAMSSGWTYINPPFYLAGHLFCWVVGGIKSASEFVSMFYEENCPPIILVSPEEEKLEEIVTKGD